MSFGLTDIFSFSKIIRRGLRDFCYIVVGKSYTPPKILIPTYLQNNLCERVEGGPNNKRASNKPRSKVPRK